jgi:hypothetical protein
MTSVLIHGMAYGLRTARDGYGYTTSAEWLDSALVNVIDSKPFNPLKAQFFYAGRPIAREDLFIIRGLSVAGRTEAISPLRAFQAYIEAGHSALEYGNGWYQSILSSRHRSKQRWSGRSAAMNHLFTALTGSFPRSRCRRTRRSSSSRCS